MSWVAFIALVIGGGSNFMGHPIVSAALADIAIVVLFAAYLVATARRPAV
jgi:hypothetical protein